MQWCHALFQFSNASVLKRCNENKYAYIKYSTIGGQNSIMVESWNILSLLFSNWILKDKHLNKLKWKDTWDNSSILFPHNHIFSQILNITAKNCRVSNLSADDLTRSHDLRKILVIFHPNVRSLHQDSLVLSVTSMMAGFH